MSSKSLSVLDSYQDQLLSKRGDRDKEIESDDDEDFMALLEEDDAELNSYRAKRMQELSEQMKQAKRFVEEGHGTVIDVLSEKELLDLTSKTKHSVVHFYHPDFKRCAIMHEKLKILANKHLSCKFVRIKVEDAPFLVTRLNIQVLPCVLAFVDGKEKLKLIGFERLGNKDDFKAEQLETLLISSNVIRRKDGGLKSSSILGFNEKPHKEDIDEDWD
ncbi:thioredoxin-like protein [Nadsonia fulvescens var. elongata DSM 6958]|uniref:Thioredoxin-like protein n=1 Tax=Nadsonia fulvescens var. elongata DSM 6958 TaxID=857566 RepID=A0A1E3PIA7_9ASCO|nr:thioredoxin-like protein [Nadsonia fulvescens var. elongata DSM 6958]